MKLVALVLLMSACASTDWRGRSIYFVVTDRFANGDRSNDDAGGFKSDRRDPRAWHGGDFAGLIAHLDYIAGMGFSGLWITPVVEQHDAHGYHGYYGWDFHAIDPHLGDLASLRKLVREAHRRGIAVMIDTVANHTGRYDDTARSFPDASLYHHNGNIKNWDDPVELERSDLNGVDDLDQDNARTRATLLADIRWLVRSTGIDGLRVDTVKHVPITFWRDFAKIAGVFTLGEALDGNVERIAPYSHALDAVLDYPLYYAVKNVIEGQSVKQLATLFAHDAQYRDASLNGLFADNHDQQRFACKHDDAALRLALALVFTVRGLPIVYYGTEQGLRDCDNAREDMRFDRTPLYDYIGKLNRQRNDALRNGAQHELYVDDSVYAFERSQGKRRAIVVFNFGATPRTITLPIVGLLTLAPRSYRIF